MKNVKTVKVEIKGEEWQNAIDKAFNKVKKDIRIDGFRKGACPKDVYIKKAGIESLFKDACDIAMDDAYKKTIEDVKMEIVVEPSVAINKLDKDGVEFEFTFIGKPEVTLGEYKKLGVKKDKVTVKKEEIEHEIEHIREHMSEVVIKDKGKVEKGDTAVIDFEGTMNGEVFDGGTGANYPLEIGSNTFIPGFEDGVIGMKVGETKNIDLKFPEDYVENLKGKDVTFKVTVQEIKTRVKPDINDDFFEDLGIEGVDSLESLQKHVEEELKHQKEHEVEDKYLDELLHKATDNMKVDINNEIIDSEINRMIHQYEQELQMQGITFEQYLSFTNNKLEDVKTMMKPQAIARIKTRYLLEAVAEKEKVEVSEKEVKDEIKTSLEKYNMKEEDFLNAIGGEEMVKYDLKMRKALDIIKES